ncbi:PX domain containing protein [Trichomonas vaginalis G3]|uniref:PX domain containing protein n=1 Tax=Trichomonas vaginalis (strain ATCC PRA-98 / G3) TaxID=412133 RepID=A2E3Q0_TRIV3|nr:phosphatidylinositol binding [Trichomonas vaginalis G3]EAY12688.1 PX domain containing protein [Trichomonas vaginalis G3]KAI5517550.1 phosphatidylinositol binding [Trichomonas vaginalis G3]|eukprot:XP_001324911.1 PX domain containing protein [Trichomonas vaginalis G3]
MATEIPVASLPQKKLQQLQSSTVDPRMYLFIEKFDLDPTINAVVYDIEVGIQKENIVHIHKIQRRYSQLFEFDSQIRPLYKENRFLQAFPPKKMFGNKDKAFLDQRAEALQKYLTNLVKVAGVISTPHFCRCFEIDPNLLNE